MMDEPPAFFGRELFDALTAAAAAAPRRRMNRNFHCGDDHPAHRFLNAVEPDSYIRPHRHPHALKDETFVVLRGAFGVLLFDEIGGVAQTRVIRAGGELVGAHVPARVFHALVSLESGSIFFEVKAGPYDARTDKQWPAWAPAEDDPAAPSYLAKLRTLFA
jgi:cupin fold WbuC family metalloprotein